MKHERADRSGLLETPMESGNKVRGEIVEAQGTRGYTARFD
jgi:hypothetical protein